MKRSIILVSAFLFYALQVSAQQFWAPTNGLSTEHVLSLAANSQGHIFAGTEGHGIYVSTDLGESWRPISNGLTYTVIDCITISPFGDLYAGANSGGVFRSTNNGANWIRINGTMPSIFVHSIIINSSNHVFVGDLLRGTHRSTNGGNDWLAVTMDCRLRTSTLYVSVGMKHSLQVLTVQASIAQPMAAIPGHRRTTDTQQLAFTG